MSPFSENYCNFQRFLLFQNKARNAGCSRKNAGNKQKCGISRTIAGRLTPMCISLGHMVMVYEIRSHDDDDVCN